MSFVRPEIARALSRWSEVLAAATVAGLGAWLASLGGPVMLVLGGATLVVSLALGVIAWRRMRFRLDVEAPGIVTVDEGRIAYFGPITGGVVALSDLVEIEVIDVAGNRRCWRLRQSDGQMLLVPLAANGAAALYDHFATLPGMEARSLLAALEGDAVTARRIWRRPRSAPALPRS